MSISTGVTPATSEESSGRSVAALAIGLTLLMFGIMFTFIGLIFAGLCLIDGGIVCQGTALGSIGSTMLGFGVPATVIGVLLFRQGRRAERAALKTRLSHQVSANSSSAVGSVVPTIVRSDCPHCGGPIQPGAAACEWCGEALR